MQTQFDQRFSGIASLKWLPWVGRMYSLLPVENRMLIVGESHYHDGSDKSIADHNEITMTRDVIQELAIERNYYGTKIFPNLHKALFRNDEFNTELFWHNTVYYNFIQRSMNTNAERPYYDDFHKSWSTFFELLAILKPATCLFIGTTAANSLLHAISEQNTLICSEVKWEDFISNAYAKSAVITYPDNTLCQVIFIRHTSQMFSWDRWNSYIAKRMSEQLNWLKAKVND